MADAAALAARPALEVVRSFAAPREAVFRAFTDPQALSQWFGPSDAHEVPVAEIDLRVGGRYRIDMRGPSGTLYRVVGEYLAIDRPQRLVYTWRWELGDDVGETLVTVELRERDGTTELRLRHERFPSDAARDGHEGGWAGCLERLARIL